MHLVAVAHGLDIRRDFPSVFRIAAGLANRHIDRFTRVRAVAPRMISLPPERKYPPAAEVEEVLAKTVYVSDDADARGMLESRGLDVERIDDLALARVLPAKCTLPRWARYRGRPWNETDHRLLLPVVNEAGAVVSVRASRIGPGETPKRLPPAGFKAAGLVLACGGARAMLAGNVDGFPDPMRIVVTEGEPDFLTWATRSSDADADAPIVIGIVSGSWSDEIAARIPKGASVTIRTDHDDAGDRYAAEVAQSLRVRCSVLRSRNALRGAA